MTSNEKAWEKLFKEYDILGCVENKGFFKISATQIKKYREPRLMAKFDHSINLPKLFSNNQLTILPISRGDYIISHFDAYHEFEPNNSPIAKISIPEYIQSLDPNNITSEAIALNCALVSGIVSDFLDDEQIVPTVSGRMGSGLFNFQIGNLKSNTLSTVCVNNSQIEIDGAYEGIESLSLFEAKRDLSDDFLVRQLYYPYRTWLNKISKPIRPIFLIYSNGIYRVYEYEFTDPENYSSISLVKQKNYSIEDTSIDVRDIQDILNKCNSSDEPPIPFPQADIFDRVINLCELLYERNLNRNNITEQYAFDVRQTSYYTDAARYLGLVEKINTNNVQTYYLTEKAKKILQMNYKYRQLAFCDCILSHKVFSKTLQKYFSTGVMPNKEQIVKIMKESSLYHINSNTTYERRASTIKGWINWIINLIND